MIPFNLCLYIFARSGYVFSMTSHIVPLLSLATLAACSRISTGPARSAEQKVNPQFFSGVVQRSSLDGKQPYGPSFESTVTRAIAADGVIVECAFQEGDVFVTKLSRTTVPLTYDVVVVGASVKGIITMETAQLLAWSYDIQITAPRPGKITGSARFIGSSGLEIRKIWNGEMLIHEQYKTIPEDAFRDRVTTYTASSWNPTIEQQCHLDVR
jgi:hypothetical protein